MTRGSGFDWRAEFRRQHGRDPGAALEALAAEATVVAHHDLREELGLPPRVDVAAAPTIMRGRPSGGRRNYDHERFRSIYLSDRTIAQVQQAMDMPHRNAVYDLARIMGLGQARRQLIGNRERRTRGSGYAPHLISSTVQPWCPRPRGEMVPLGAVTAAEAVRLHRRGLQLTRVAALLKAEYRQVIAALEAAGELRPVPVIAPQPVEHRSPQFLPARTPGSPVGRMLDAQGAPLP